MPVCRANNLSPARRHSSHALRPPPFFHGFHERARVSRRNIRQDPVPEIRDMSNGTECADHFVRHATNFCGRRIQRAWIEIALEGDGAAVTHCAGRRACSGRCGVPMHPNGVGPRGLGNLGKRPSGAGRDHDYGHADADRFRKTDAE